MFNEYMNVGKTSGNAVRLMRIFGAIVALFTLFSVCAFAEGGSCGSDAGWELDESGVLTIYGKGAMADYSNAQAPWYGHRASIHSVVVEHGVTAIGDASFYGFSNLTSVKVANTVTSIGAYAFYECTSLRSIALPDGVSDIGEYAFYNNTSLKSMTATKKHTAVTVPAVAPTCAQSGLTEGVYCSDCGEILASQRTVPKTDHTPVTDPAVEATCTKTGLTEGSHCSGCGEVYSAQEEIPMLDHVEGEWVIVLEPTSAANGLKEKRCTVCGNVIETEAIPKLRMPGDVNSDGAVDGRDLIRLASYLGGIDVEINHSNASVNGDEIVDGRDLLRLAKYLGGLSVELE
ncbi:MAG: leucine-rich repeat protein [Clostridia bacterium]|nr:hypothetical protein [Clostridiales bacterium]MBQ6715755.1 leucine-rich repeat protein [Clostridia bacterium]